MVSKHMIGESWCRKHLADQKLFQLLEKIDTDLTEEARSKGCLLCGGRGTIDGQCADACDDGGEHAGG